MYYWKLIVNEYNFPGTDRIKNQLLIICRTIEEDNRKYNYIFEYKRSNGKIVVRYYI